MPRVLRIVTRLNRGGPLRQLSALVPGLADLGWTGPVVAGVCEPTEPDGRDALTGQGATVIELPTLRRGLHPARDAQALAGLVRTIREQAPDLLHTHMGKAGALGRAAGRMTGVPVVHTLHGHHFDRKGVLAQGARMAERLLGRMGHALICLSEGQRRDVVERHQVVAEAQTHVVEPGFDIDAFVASAGERTPRDEGPFRIVWTGRFVGAKRPLALLDVFAGLGMPARLDLYGDGPLRPEFEAAVRTRGLEGQVRVHGPVDPVAPLVQAADAFVLTSASEGVSLSVLEALVLGTPVAVPAVGGLPDVIRDGENGRLLPPGDDAGLASALTAWAADPARARSLAERARAEARMRFGKSRLAAETAAVYEAVLDASRSA